MRPDAIKILTGNSHPDLAKAVAERLGLNLSPCVVNKFSNQEINVRIGESVREEDVFIIQSGCGDINDSLMELLILANACKTASARRITAVIPNYPYARQDRKDKSRAPITAKLIANMLTTAGCDHVITLDLHASQIQGFFDIPVDNLYTEPIMINYVKSSIPDWEDAVVFSPDAGGAKRATALADRLNVNFGLIHRSRVRNGDNKEEDHMDVVVGNVEGKVAILIDDMVVSAQTLKLASTELAKKGATAVYAIVSHGLMSKSAMEIIPKLPIKKIAVTNTIPQVENKQKLGEKLDVMDVSATIGEAIRRQHNGESISLLFGDVKL
ncbi:phosphoribosyl pyrophosphokinase [Wallemia mellicola CBS 633.66]|uniref:ribose-phosphate diphosphokinase n=1 Tax=Wallemia mellicola (strain ATCC MYA-4683 / CBS 633.66) TaxID=671144 RepID=I4YH55_WALMC|nr:phosphoribosyl pyrophosphokinase [Wallemia mellicola CBS 633.66]EIM23297.1 phosphoribosyl pyrophosphokinase [Wallemia mellicola CBS 633.66]|eukprot:XP_006956684.1 phosphoribosyl pyrophosphokinase [Wallemia mellicola CBS 633.66]